MAAIQRIAMVSGEFALCLAAPAGGYQGWPWEGAPHPQCQDKQGGLVEGAPHLQCQDKQGHMELLG